MSNETKFLDIAYEREIAAVGTVFKLYSSPPPIEMYLPKTKRYGNDVPVRTDPKINRNAICPKCESGLKYKKCCGLNNNLQSK